VSEQGEVVAVIDDDEGLGKALCRLLRSHGHRAERFGSAEDWLGSERAENAACLIVDVCLPGLTGLELQRHLLSSQRRIPILFFSAQADEEARTRALEAGALDFLSKPADVDRLLEQVRRTVGNGQ
jgi:FixJ family two-component response regulator